MLKVILRIVGGFLILFAFYTIHFITTKLVEGSMPGDIYTGYRILSNAFFSILGGYFTSRIAKENHWRNVIAVAILTLIYMLANISTIQPGEGLFFAASLTVMLGGIILGGYLDIRKRK